MHATCSINTTSITGLKYWSNVDIIQRKADQVMICQYQCVSSMTVNKTSLTANKTNVNGFEGLFLHISNSYINEENNHNHVLVINIQFSCYLVFYFFQIMTICLLNFGSFLKRVHHKE